VGDTDDPALEPALAAVGRDPALTQELRHLGAVDRVGQLDGGHHGRALVGVAEELESEPPRAGPGRPGQEVMARQDGLEPLLLD
jgi:hypothetical protein